MHWLTSQHGVTGAGAGRARPLPALVYSINAIPGDATEAHRRQQERWRALWVPLSGDDVDTRAFVAACQPSALRDGFATLLRAVMSRTDANGMSGRGKMFVLSRAQLRLLCAPVLDAAVAKLAEAAGAAETAEAAVEPAQPPPPPPPPPPPLRLLDIGSGDGSITERFAPLFGTVVTTETSGVMARKLRQRGWECYEPPGQSLPPPRSDCDKFDVITCFNVLDRADAPRSLLASLAERLKPGCGRLVLAVSLPWCPFVEGGTRQLQPSEKFPMQGASCRDGASFEASLDALLSRVLEPAGFRVCAVSRVPYISEGDQSQRYYVLQDAIIVLAVADASSISDESSESKAKVKAKVAEAEPEAGPKNRQEPGTGSRVDKLAQTS